MPHPNISCNFFMPIIVKHQPLHRSSMPSPHYIAAIFFLIFDIILDIAHWFSNSHVILVLSSDGAGNGFQDTRFNLQVQSVN